MAARAGRRDIYQPLDSLKREIRVLNLLPAKNPRADLRATLEVVSLDSRPHYRALSYCWGRSPSPAPIAIDGCDIHLTGNLDAALRQLRQANDRLCLWIDALCINQEDVHERSQQVQLMAAIYSSAETVVVWLGEEADGSSLAFDTIQEWATQFLIKKDKNYLFELSRKEGLDIKAWTAIKDLLDRPYWSRTWIFQEIMLGRQVVVQCGDKKLDWGDFRALDKAHTQLIRKEEIMKSHMIPDQYKMKVEVEKRIMRMTLFFRFDVVEEAEDRLSALLRWTSNMECQDSRDHIYAMLGFMEDISHYPAPDYSIAPATVFTGFARSQIERTNTLAILHDRACRQSGTSTLDIGDTLPTWVPDWTQKAVLQQPLTLGDETYFNAASSIPYLVSDLLLTPSSRALPVDGVEIDRISRVASKSLLDLGLPGALAFIENSTYERKTGGYIFLKGYKHKYPTGEPLMFVLLRTCVLDIDFRFATRLEIVPERAFLLREISQGFLIRLCIDYGSFKPSDVTMEDYMDSHMLPPFDLDFEFLPKEIADKMGNGVQGPQYHSFKAFMEHFTRKDSNDSFYEIFRMMFDRHMSHLAGNRRLFMTEKGYFGLSTNSDLKPGDVLAVLFGCTTPVILRPADNSSGDNQKYEFISDVYVHGLMDGQAVAGIHEDTRDGKKHHSFGGDTTDDRTVKQFVLV